MEVVYFPPKTETAAEEPPNAAPTAPESTNPPALKVIIVGGGIGGQTAAIALRQQGHHVKVRCASIPKAFVEFDTFSGLRAIPLRQRDRSRHPPRAKWPQCFASSGRSRRGARSQ